MRIGILTYHCVPNFGAQLQALSTIGYLRRIGHEAFLLHWYAKDLEEMYSHRVPSEQIEIHSLFASQNFSLTKKCKTEAELIDTIDNLHLDAIIAGSDALFKYIPLRQRRHFSIRKLKYIYHFTPLSVELLEENPFWGDFIKRLHPRIPSAVYAASSQNCPYQALNFWERRKMAKALSNYHFLSARDSWTQQMLQFITRKTEIPVFPDPVFSFNQNCYLHIPSKDEVIKRFHLSKDYVLFSFSDWYVKEEYITRLAEEASRQNLLPVALPMPEKLHQAGIPNKVSLPLSPIWWYALIIHSCGYVGERMHPIVVCLHNVIPFFCFDEYGTQFNPNHKEKDIHIEASSSKTYSIISDAGLLENYYSYLRNEQLPEPESVIKKLSSFNRESCSSFSRTKQQEYEKGMNSIINFLV